MHINSPLKVCECGHCNELIHSIDVNGDPARYKREHFSKYVFGKTGVKTRFKKGQVTEWTFVKGKRKPHQAKADKADGHWNWKGGRILSHEYYIVYKPDHHFADNKGYVKEHRLVWEEYHNACLLPWAIVHHINGNKTDNRPENLDVMSPEEHCGLHKPSRWRGRD